MADGSKSTNKLQQLFKFMCNRCFIKFHNIWEGCSM